MGKDTEGRGEFKYGRTAMRAFASVLQLTSLGITLKIKMFFSENGAQSADF